MPGMERAAAIRALKEQHPKVQIIALASSDEDDLVLEALHANALSFLDKTATASELVYAIRATRD